MASITSLGIGSGLDLNSLLDKLTKAEQGRLTPYVNQQSSYKAQLTAFGTLKSALSKFDDLSAALAKNDFFSATTINSDSKAFSASSSASAQPGNYTILVEQLAQAQTLMTQGNISSQSEQLGTAGASGRTLTLTTEGNPPKTTEIPLSDDQTSLLELRDAINGAKAGVTASIIRVKDDEYQLSISSSQTGEDNTISLSVKNDDKLNSLLNYDSASGSGAMKETAAAQNAKIQMNGLDIERSSNTITDAPQGVTITLKAKSKEPETMTIGVDTAGIVDKIKSWVDSYNSLQDTFSSLTKYTPVKSGEAQSTKNGALLGDSTLRGIQSTIESTLNAAQGNPDLKGLESLGISTDLKTGKLSLDTEKLTKALTDKPEQVRNFFAGDTKETGMATQLHTQIQDYIKKDGVIDTSTESINLNLTRLDSQITSLNSSIASTIARYQKQFVQLDTMMSKLNNTSAYLSQQFTAMSKQ